MSKKVRFYLLRHGKNEKGLEATLPASELHRVSLVGSSIADDFTKVTYSPLARAIQTAFGVILGNCSDPALLEAVPAFGNQALFTEMTAPPGFREIASAKGNYMALYDVHDKAKVEDWRFDTVNAFYGVFQQCVDDDVVLVVAHSPTIEMMVDGLLRRQSQQSPDGLLTLSELDSVVIEATQEVDGGFISVHVIGKNALPAAV